LRKFQVPPILLVAVCGCGVPQAKYSSGESKAVDDSRSMFTSTDAPLTRSPPGTEKAAGGKAESDVPAKLAAVPRPEADRKIIYTGQIDLVVEDFEKFRQRVTELVAEANGYIDQFREDRTRGDRLAGHWVVRVPSTGFESFLEKIAELGVPETLQTDAQDVTEEYVDLGARIENKKKLEARIRELLEKREGKIDEVIKVESKLAEVRGEIERMQGRLNYLASRSSLSTITINAREEDRYAPPQEPAFGKQIAGTWGGSLDAMARAGKGLVLLAVGGAPWLALVAFVGFPLLWMLRRRAAIKGA